MAVPLHLVGAGVALDNRTPGVAARAPQSMVQDFLNRARRCLWGIVSNGHSLRVLRDASSLTKQSYVEFDLDDIFDNQRYADFRLFFLTIHASRTAPIPAQTSAATRADDDEATTDAEALLPESCWLELWRTAAIADGARALEALREGVAEALTHLGTGFVSHPANSALLATLAASPDADKDLHRALLRIAYRFIVLFVAEDRELLHTANTDIAAQALYTQYFSTARLRNLATSRTGTRHSDLWEAHQIVTDALAGDGLDALALPGLGATLFARDSLGVLGGATLSNRSLLAAVRALAEITDPKTGLRRHVDYRNLDSEELGGVYEGLLAYVPRFDPAARTFELTPAPGNERKTSGSFYTGDVLISLILDETLNPLIDEALRVEDAEAALLALTVCDPACGSGHFLVAAARRIAHALAAVRTGEAVPSPKHFRFALRDTIGRCIYGVDFNDLAIEITKVALWLEAFDGSRPFPFLDGHLKVGNALLGATPTLLQLNIPDAAFNALPGDDKPRTTALRKRNMMERQTGQMSLLDPSRLDVATPGVAKRALEFEAVPTDTLEAARVRADAWRRLEHGEELANAKHLADAWCAAFMQPKSRDAESSITHATLVQIQDEPDQVAPVTTNLIKRIARQYRFFHWHLEFPTVFQAQGVDVVDSPTRRPGGFSAIIGNPPWDTLGPDTREFFGDLVPDIRSLPKVDKDAQIKSLLQDENYQLRWNQRRRELSAIAHFLKASGRYTMYAKGNLGKGDFNVYRSFVELALTHTAVGGYVGQILQSGIYAGANVSAIRKQLLDRHNWTAVYGFDNKGGTWFPGITLENFGAYAAQVGCEAPAGHAIRAAFGLRRPEALAKDLISKGLTVTPADIRLQNPETYTIPDVRNPRTAHLSSHLYRCWKPFGMKLEGAPNRDCSRELDMTNDSSLFRSKAPGLPVYEGRMIDYYDHRAKEYVVGHGNSSVWSEMPFGYAQKKISPQWYVKASDLPSKLRSRSEIYRIGFMNIADPGRQRSFCSAIIPPGSVCGNKVPTLFFPDNDWYLPVYLAVANSVVIDFIARQKLMSKTMTHNILDSLPIARLARTDRRCSWLAERALTLTCTSIEMTPLWNQMAELGWVEPCSSAEIPGESNINKRRLLRSEIDAFVAREVYKLGRLDLELILDSFVQLASIERKVHGEFLTQRLTLESYDRMATAIVPLVANT
ncbi:Eco57I restriction-modification methylase domain-containing protein [Kutzneria chonburiensis]|uniref:Eco57I restriction-modification methylase domain-containing protein n=1 Tax=Kutzneria chonburiensis TaxID=1483604 RepID=UPI00236016BE|nr:DNA methyltransferase [Kutzneria chonburiensis]